MATLMAPRNEFEPLTVETYSWVPLKQPYSDLVPIPNMATLMAHRNEFEPLRVETYSWVPLG